MAQRGSRAISEMSPPAGRNGHGAVMDEDR